MGENQLDKLLEIHPMFFALASQGRSVDRKDTGDDWDEVLNANGISAEEFAKYERWWFGSEGEELVGILKKKLINSILQSILKKDHLAYKSLLERANWRDFISELSGFLIKESDDFLQYALHDGLFLHLDASDVSDSGVKSDEKFEVMQGWFTSKAKEAREVLLEAHPTLVKLATA
jgi:hypothetical protein